MIFQNHPVILIILWFAFKIESECGMGSLPDAYYQSKDTPYLLAL